MNKQTVLDSIRNFVGFRFFKNLYLNQRSVIAATFLSAAALIFFVTIAYPQFFARLSFFSQRSFSLAAVVAYISLTIVFCFLFQRKYSLEETIKSLGLFLQSNILALVFFAYFVRLNLSLTVTLFSQSFNNGLLLVPLTVIIFVFNENLFGKHEYKLPLIVLPIFLFCLQVYSFLSLVHEDRTYLRVFAEEWLSSLFSLPPLIWLAFAAFAISLVSVFILPMEKLTRKLLFLGVFWLVMFQGMVGIYLLKYTSWFQGISYWQETLLTLIYWDMFFMPLKDVFLGQTDFRFGPKLIISIIYHVLLFLLVLSFILFVRWVLNLI